MYIPLCNWINSFTGTRLWNRLRLQWSKRQEIIQNTTHLSLPSQYDSMICGHEALRQKVHYENNNINQFIVKRMLDDLIFWKNYYVFANALLIQAAI